MTTYTLPEVPRVTIERNRREVRLVREVRDHKTGKSASKCSTPPKRSKSATPCFTSLRKSSKKTANGCNMRSRFAGRTVAVKIVRAVLAAPFGVLAFLFMFLASCLAKAAMGIAGIGGKGPITMKVQL